MAKIEKVSTIILAAGSSKRMGRDKQFIKLRGEYIIGITLRAFLALPCISEVILALSKENIEKYGDKFRDHKIKVVSGGKTRMDSLKNSFKVVTPSAKLVAVHDGARPFVKKELILNCLKVACEYGAAVPGVPVKDTIKEINDSFDVVKTVNRERYYAVQTPQCYKRELLMEMLDTEYSNTDLSDESQILEKIGRNVKIVMGDYANIKITTKEDLIFAEGFYEKKH